MKTLIILAVILGILFLYFIVKAEKSFVIKGNEVVPSGIDIPKLILDKAAQVLGNNVIGDLGQGFINNMTADVKDLTSKAAYKINESIKSSVKSSVENKINEVICPQKWNF